MIFVSPATNIVLDQYDSNKEASMLDQKQMYLTKLVDFANKLGYDVELESMMEGSQHLDEEGNVILNDKGVPSSPAGDCHYAKRRLRVRAGKSLDGNITTMIHELSHTLGLGSTNYLAWAGTPYVELAAESVTQLVTNAIGIDRSKKTAGRIASYGFGGYLISPVTITISEILLDVLLGE
jgi:hypothetical protein